MAKYEAKTKATHEPVQAFIESIADPDRRADARRIDAMLRRVTGHEPQMWGPAIIGYGEYHYRYDSGHQGDAPRLGFSPRKKELVLYLLSYDTDPVREEEALLTQLGRHRRGKTCLYIRRLDEIDADVLEQLARLSWERMAERYPD